VAVLGAAGELLASGPAPLPEAAAGPVLRLWEAAEDRARDLGDAPLDHVVVPGAEGAVAVVSAHGRRIAALTGPRPAVGLLLFDLRTCLGDAYAAEEAVG
jgi:hypothetical protein